MKRDSSARPLISIVIPAYNEEKRLARTIRETMAWSRNNLEDCEILVVDDGSSDQTLAIARSFLNEDVCLRALACPHRGKGGAVRSGMLAAEGRYVLFMDADGATPLSETDRLLAALQNGYDVAVGSRVTNDADTIVKSSVARKGVRQAFISLVHLLASSGVRDTQCGFKMFRREVVRPIFSRQSVDGFAFDVEILLIARKLRLSIAEVGVNWTAQPGSTVNLLTDSFRMLRDIIRIRWVHRNTRSAGQVELETE
ncbi:MAG TPA: dolichyl-phosphate beta-glucosyltransferase [Terriglobia bacterium]|nr:dolichyl-phosphate beta-glucosyltransferase [Terriglobia bacterium]